MTVVLLLTSNLFKSAKSKINYIFRLPGLLRLGGKGETTFF